MNKITVFLFVLFFTCFAFGQKYVPFPTEHAEWNVRFVSGDDGASLLDTTMLSYSLNGDTLLNGINYKKIYSNSGSFNQPIYQYKGGLREENKVVYFLSGQINGYGYLSDKGIKKMKSCGGSMAAYSDSEIKLYDFNNNQVGDTISYNFFPTIIKGTDSVLVGNSYRKRYHINGLFSDDYIIEGIGSVVSGIFGSITDIPMCGHYEWEFVCLSQNGETVYKNPEYSECTSYEKWNDNPLRKNTQWYYGEIDYPFYTSTIQFDNYNSLKSVGDTTILGLKYNILSQVRGNAGCASFENPAYAFQYNKTVYFYNSKTTRFSTLYMYDAGKGDSWNVAYPMGDVNVMVDSVGTVEAFGQTLKLQHVTYSSASLLSNGYSEKSIIIENIGDINYFFQSCLFQQSDWACDEFFIERTGLRCYSHPDYGTYNPGTISCDYVTSLHNAEYTSVNVYINSAGNLKIETELLNETCIFELLDVRGTVLLRTEVNASANTLNFTPYNKGFYVYRLTKNGKLMKSGKIVKM